MEQSGVNLIGSTMFLGQYEHTFDEKGRLIIPARFRELLGEEFIITFGLDSCLFIYPIDEWNKLIPILNNNKKERTVTINGVEKKYRNREDETLFIDLRKVGVPFENVSKVIVIAAKLKTRAIIATQPSKG